MRKQLLRALSQTTELTVTVETYTDHYIDDQGKQRYRIKDGVFVNGLLVYKASDFIPLRRGLITHYPALKQYGWFYVLLLQLADFRTGELYITRRILEILTQNKERWVQRALAALERQGYISYARAKNRYGITKIVIHRFSKNNFYRDTGDGVEASSASQNDGVDSPTPSKQAAVASDYASSNIIFLPSNKSMDFKKYLYKKSMSINTKYIETDKEPVDNSLPCLPNSNISSNSNNPRHGLIDFLSKNLKTRGFRITRKSLRIILTNFCSTKKKRGWCLNPSDCRTDFDEILNRLKACQNIRHPTAYIKQAFENYLNENADEISERMKKRCLKQ